MTAPMGDAAWRELDVPMPPAVLRGLFERLEEISSTGYDCDHTLVMSRRFLAEHGVDVEAAARWLGENGAGCDCEVIFNVAQHWEERVGFVAKGVAEDSAPEPARPAVRLPKLVFPKGSRRPSRPWWKFW